MRSGSLLEVEFGPWIEEGGILSEGGTGTAAAGREEGREDRTGAKEAKRSGNKAPQNQKGFRGILSYYLN